MEYSIEKIYQLFLECGSVSIDTRNLKQDSMFIALKGNNYDANNFITQAFEKGAKYVITENILFKDDPKCIYVDSALSTLQSLANFHRRKFTIPVLAITGSNGKTTTKELIYSVLSSKYRCCATIGNLNNHIGVPLTLLSITSETQFAIIEMGANHPGEIKLLSEISMPTHGLITNIGTAHLDGFKTHEGILMAKTELFQFLSLNSGVVFIHSNHSELIQKANEYGIMHPVQFGSVVDYFSLKGDASDWFVVIYDSKDIKYTTQLMGEHNLDNIISALCIGKYFGIEEKQAFKSVANYKPSHNRSQKKKIKTNTVIMDAYNANPSSMIAALKHFSGIKAENKMIIIGDMFELGEFSKDLHGKIGELLKTLSVGKVVFCGKEMEYAFLKYPQGKYFNTTESLKKWIQENTIQNSTILIKASRGMALERVIEWI